MDKLTVFLDPHWRCIDELFSPATLDRIRRECVVVWGKDEKAPLDIFLAALPKIDVLITPDPHIDQNILDKAPNLKAIIEVSGAFPDTIDYVACAASGVEILSCAPGFQNAVAEMALGMMLAGARGLVAEHENFRTGKENWLSDNPDTDFSLFGATVGFVGYGSIARATHRLIAPFAPKILAYDPWLDPGSVNHVTLLDLKDVAAQSQYLIIAASPTQENQGMINADLLEHMPNNAVLIVISRAHLVNFPDLVDALRTGRIRAAIDVFPSEPVPIDHPLRQFPNAILSPHRAAAVTGGRQLIGDMIVDDLAAIASNAPTRRLTKADPNRVAKLLGVGDAASVADMAINR